MKDNESPRITWLGQSLDAVPNDDDRWIDDALAARLATMRFTKRRSETTMARWTAKVAIARTYGLPADPAGLARVIVRNAFDGAPEAAIDGRAIDSVIAMTDRADVAVCMVISGTGRIGCDLELVEPRTPAFVADYFTTTEQAAVAYGPEPDLISNLIWSAKESVLKVLRTGLRRDTRTVEVTIGDRGDGPWRSFEATGDDGRRFPGWWLRTGDFVLTCATETDTDPPVSLIEPHGLTHARPGHAWMNRPLIDGER